ncbi:MAG TPA: DUF3618 domain-containing protein [Micromonosporaceae bacterium]|jgi:hypothetical protein
MTSADELRTEIDATRQDLGETIEALAAKTDVKARAKNAVDEKIAKTKDTAGDMISTAKDKAGDALEAVPPGARKQLPVAAFAAIGAAVAGLVYRVWRRRR